MNERTVKAIQGWGRRKRRKRILIRNVRPIANVPEFACSKLRRCNPLYVRMDDASAPLAKCLRLAAVAPCDENRVDERLTFQSEAAAMRGPPPAPTRRAAASRAQKPRERPKIR